MSKPAGNEELREQAKKVFLANQITDSEAEDFEDIEWFDTEAVIDGVVGLITASHQQLIQDKLKKYGEGV